MIKKSSNLYVATQHLVSAIHSAVDLYARQSFSEDEEQDVRTCLHENFEHYVTMLLQKESLLGPGMTEQSRAVVKKIMAEFLAAEKNDATHSKIFHDITTYRTVIETSLQKNTGLL